MQWWSDCERDFKNSIQGGWKFWSFLHPPLMTNTPHRISSTFQAKTTWGGNILLGQDCLLKIWTNMTWNFPLLLNIFCGSKSSSSSSQFWNDFDFFILLAFQAKIILFLRLLKVHELCLSSDSTPFLFEFLQMFWRTFVFKLLTFKVCWRSKSHPPSQTQKWNWPRKIRRGTRKISPDFYLVFTAH